ncbi:MAG TPA: hypothetical protein DHV59_14690 [Oxalobacteraceae bacterium]|nr:hypothetical protein [Oxalobacteraceae bacterium]
MSVQKIPGPLRRVGRPVRLLLGPVIGPILRDIGKRMQGLADHCAPILPPPLSERELLKQRWDEDLGDKELRQEYSLTSNEVVLDIGGYEGQWASDIVARYGCRVHVFEPVPEFAQRIAKRFASNTLVTVHAAGAGPTDDKMEMRIAADASSQFGEGGAHITVPVIGLPELMLRENMQEISLMKVNIEGGEYALLEGLLDAGMMPRIRELQVQFHDFAPDAEARMKAIQARLAQTHEVTYQYRFIWENWRRRDHA